MKFSELRVGEEFEFNGQRYRKISPLMAASLESKDQQLIRRSSDVTLINTPSAPEASQASTLDRETVRASLDEHHAALRELVTDHCDEDQLKELQEQLSSLQNRLYRKLNID